VLTRASMKAVRDEWLHGYARALVGACRFAGRLLSIVDLASRAPVCEATLTCDDTKRARLRLILLRSRSMGSSFLTSLLTSR